MYGGQFYAPIGMQVETARALDACQVPFACCAESILAERSEWGTAQGCISYEDLELMGLITDNMPAMYTNPQKRSGCLCLSCKAELLTHKAQCPNQCAYCYWKN